MSSTKHTGTLGIHKVSDYKYIVPVKPDKVGIVYGYEGKNMKKIMDKFDTTIIFKMASFYGVHYSYPEFIVTGKKELDIWDTINYIYYLTTLPNKHIICIYSSPQHKCSYICNEFKYITKILTERKEDGIHHVEKRIEKLFGPCHCGDSFGDTFEYCIRCRLIYYDVPWILKKVKN